MTDTSGSATAPAVGTRVGEYELVHDLGTKGDTSAFLARSKGANGIVRVVVLELVADALVQRAGGAAAVTESAQTAIKVKSLNVVSPLDSKNDSGLAIVSDTVDGASLHDVLEAARAAGEKIGIDVALRIVVDTLAGLNAAHQNKPNAILHGGLTPERLIIASEGTTKVTDFALARWREEASRAAYALDAAESPSVANDVFAAGVVAWELITGKRLFGGDSPALGDRAAEIPAPSTVVEGVSAKLDAAVTKALSREASARYATAAEFSRAVESSGTKVALRSAVGALITKLLKEPLAQRRDLVRRLRTAGTAMSAASGFAAGIGAASASAATPPAAGAGAPAPARMPGRPLSAPGASISPPGKPGEGLRKPTMIGMPKPPTIEPVAPDASASDAAKEKEAPAAVTPAAPAEAASKSETPSGESAAAPSSPASPASKFGAPLVAPSGASTAPKTIGVAPTKIAAAVTPKADSTMPLEVGDVVSVPPPTPDRTMNVDIAEVTEIAASDAPVEKFAKVVTPAASPAAPAAIPSATTTQPGVTATPPAPPAPTAPAATTEASATETKSATEAPATTPAATTPAATTPAASSAASEVEVVRDSEIPIEAYESLPPALQGDDAAAAIPPATAAKLSVPPAPAPTPTGEGFDDEDIKPKNKGPVSLPTQSLDSFDEPLDAGPQKSKTPLYAGIVVVCLLVGGITLAMRGGSSTSSTASSPNTANATADAGSASSATTNNTANSNAAPDVSAAPPPVAQNTAAPSAAEAGAAETPDASAVAANEPAADAGAAAPPVVNPTPPPEPPTTVAQNDEPPPAPTPPPARTPPAARVTPPPPARTAHTAPPPAVSHPAPPARNPVVRAPPAVRTATRPPPASRTPAVHQATPPAGGRHEFRPGGL